MTTLPVEVWHEIYKYLNKTDVKKCKTVCKRWNELAYYYQNNAIRLHLCGHRFEKLAEDLNCCPTLKYRIKDLVFHKSLDNASQRVIFKTILDHCTQVRLLTFCDFVHPAALNLLCNANTKILASIEEIRGLSWSKHYLMINFRFRNTITLLNIENIGKNKTLYEHYGDLIEFTSQFPHLKTLYTNWYQRTSAKNPVDLNKLILANKQLEELVLDNVCVKKKYTLNDIKRKSYPPLKQLIVRAKDVDITVFQYILPQLNQLDKLSLHIKNITPHRSLSTVLADHIINHVCKQMSVKYKVIDCRYKKVLYTSFIKENKVDIL